MKGVHLIFDLDDTLYPERAWAIGGFRAAGVWAEQTFGATGVAERLTALLDDGHLGQAFKIALKEAVPGHTDDDLKGLLKAYAAQVPDVSLFPDAAAALNHFSAASLGLITDGHAKTQAAKVEALDIAPRFREIVYTGALGPDRAFHKPHPKAFEIMEAALRQHADDQFVYVGDNPTKDFVSPNAMGWRTVLVDRPEHRRHRIHPLKDAVPGGAAQRTVATLDVLREAAFEQWCRTG